MPIYAYKCGSCGHAKDVLQKISDPQLTVCPACGAEAFTKQVTAAGFQLKGSGWYVTDFRGGNGSQGAAEASSGGVSAGAKSDTKAESPSTTQGETSASASAASAPKKEASNPGAASANGISSSTSSSSS